MLKQLEQGDHTDEIKKSIGKLTRMEKRRIKAGDKTVIFQRLGIAEEEDIDRLKRRFGVKSKQDEQNIDEILESATNLGKKRSRRKVANEQMAKDNLKSMIEERNQQLEDEQLMDEDEIKQQQMMKAKVQEMFRDDHLGYQPVIIKSSQAGSLETLMVEAEKIIGD